MTLVDAVLVCGLFALTIGVLLAMYALAWIVARIFGVDPHEAGEDLADRVVRTRRW